MKLTWLGHACFMLESKENRLVLDPFAGVPGLRDVDTEAEQVLCSHDHFDHHYLAGVKLHEGGASPFAVSTVATFHDAQGGALRGSNTVHILSAERCTVVHLGDLGHRLTEAQAEPLRNCDVLLLPVGGTYTIDAEQAAETVRQLQPRVVIPMHYRAGAVGFANLGGVEPLAAALPDWDVRRYAGSSLDVTAETDAQIALLQPLCKV